MADTKFSTHPTANGGTRITLSIGEFKGHKYIMVQKEYKKYGSEEWHPGKAATMPLELWPDFVQQVAHFDAVLGLSPKKA